MKHTILVVEDDARSRKLIRDFLTVKGMTVLEAENGQTGLALALGHKPAVILMDIQLPLLSGIEATVRLKQNPATRQIPIVTMTASVTDQDRESMQKAGCAAFLPKPVDLRLLWTTLTALLPAPMPQEDD